MKNLKNRLSLPLQWIRVPILRYGVLKPGIPWRAHSVLGLPDPKRRRPTLRRSASSLPHPAPAPEQSKHGLPRPESPRRARLTAGRGRKAGYVDRSVQLTLPRHLAPIGITVEKLRTDCNAGRQPPRSQYPYDAARATSANGAVTGPYQQV